MLGIEQASCRVNIGCPSIIEDAIQNKIDVKQLYVKGSKDIVGNPKFTQALVKSRLSCQDSETYSMKGAPRQFLPGVDGG